MRTSDTGDDHDGDRTPSSEETELRALIVRAYEAFNERRIADALALMDPDVEWPKAWEGDVVHGHAGIRDYWTRQWASIDPHVEPGRITKTPDGRWRVEVHQTVRDLHGALLADQQVRHVYTVRGGRIQRMEIESVA